MALVPVVLDMFRHAAGTLEASRCENRRVLALGYPDILASPKQTGAQIERVAARIRAFF